MKNAGLLAFASGLEQARVELALLTKLEHGEEAKEGDQEAKRGILFGREVARKKRERIHVLTFFLAFFKGLQVQVHLRSGKK